MKKIAITSILLLSVIVVKAQTDIKNQAAAVVSADTINIEEREPTFPGGITELSKFLKNNVTYNGTDKGRVVVSFIVEKDGTLSEIKIVDGLSRSADKAVLNAMRKMPNWLPGIQNRRLLRVRYSLPISF